MESQNGFKTMPSHYTDFVTQKAFFLWKIVNKCLVSKRIEFKIVDIPYCFQASFFFLFFEPKSETNFFWHRNCEFYNIHPCKILSYKKLLFVCSRKNPRGILQQQRASLQRREKKYQVAKWFQVKYFYQEYRGAYVLYFLQEIRRHCQTNKFALYNLYLFL